MVFKTENNVFKDLPDMGKGPSRRHVANMFEEQYNAEMNPCGQMPRELDGFRYDTKVGKSSRDTKT